MTDSASIDSQTGIGSGRFGRTGRRRGLVGAGWLVTYADLMTILVCFFVLIVSFSIQDQVRMEVVAGSMRDAFGVAEERRFAGDIKLPGVPERRQPGSVSPSPNPTGAGLTETLSARPVSGDNGSKASSRAREARRRQFDAVKADLQKAILAHPVARAGADAITVNLTDDGLQVLLVDTEGRAMFETGAREPTPLARALLQEAARALAPLANRVIVEAHADAAGSGQYSAFALTAARAEAARQIMEAAGLPATRFAGLMARGDSAPLYPENPAAPANRRIEIILEDAAPVLPPDFDLSGASQ